MPSKKKIYALARSYSDQLETFSSELKGKFQCPACMRSFDVFEGNKEISAAHILPESIGYQRWTLLCKKCNNDFGRHQDKWFGEYLSVLLQEKGTFFHTKTKSKYLEINGKKVSGTITPTEDDVIQIFLPIDRNPPGKVEALEFGPELNVSFSPEVVKHEQEISIGYLTAAYLLWYEALGYNWVYQTSLDIVRKQITNPRDKVWDDFLLFELEGDNFVDPQIGLIQGNNGAYPAAIIYDRIVIFPPPEGINIKPYHKNSQSGPQTNFIKIQLGVFDKPAAVMYEDTFFVLPNMIRNKEGIPKFAFRIPSDINQQPHWLYRTI